MTEEKQQGFMGFLRDNKGNNSSVRIMSFFALLAATYMGCQLINVTINSAEATKAASLATQQLSALVGACAHAAGENQALCAESLKKANDASALATTASLHASKLDGMQDLLYLVSMFLTAAFAPKVFQKFAENKSP